MKKVLGFGWLRLSWLGLFWIMFSIPMGISGEAPDINLTLQNLNEVRELILSNDMDFGKRVELAASVTRIMEKSNLSAPARLLCLDFYSSIASFLDSAKTPAAAPLPSPYNDYAQAIERGKRQATMKKIGESLDLNGKTLPPSYVSLLALKADDMSICYFALFADFSRRQITPYSDYVLGILAAREKRFVEAERFFAAAQGRLGSPLLERWLTYDQAKIAIVTQNLEKTNAILDDLLKKNPNDVQALKMKMMLSLDNNKQDLARQQLARLQPLLYEDPYLIADVAAIALRLNEKETAESILTQYEKKLEPTRDFYQAFVLLYQAQGKTKEAEKYLEKARQIQDSRVAVAGLIPKSDQLIKLLASAQEKRKKEIDSIEGIDPLSKVYLYLLDKDADNAILELKKIIQSPNPHENERFILAALQRRIGLGKEALQNLQALKTETPAFRPYFVLTLLADLSVRLNDPAQAKIYYQEILNRYPESYQAVVAKRYLENPSPAPTEEESAKITVSPMMSRYTQYAAPFLLTEIMNYWGDRTTFTKVNDLLGTSPRRGMQFHEWFTLLFKGTRYKVTPLVGKSSTVQGYLKQGIPIVFCEGEMFLSQRLSNLLLLVGADPARGIFYAEGVSPSDPHILTEPELLEGICLAVYPGSLNETPSADSIKSASAGSDYIVLNAASAMVPQDSKLDPSKFYNRLRSLAKDNVPYNIPLQLAAARWIIRNATEIHPEEYLAAIKPNCSQTGQFWFILADQEFRQKNVSQAKESLDRAMKLNPESPRFELAKVRMLFKEGDVATSLQMTENLRQQYPDDPIVSTHLIALYEKTKDTKKKAAEVKRLKELFHLDSVEIDFEGQPSAAQPKAATAKPAPAKPAPKAPAAKKPTPKKKPSK